MTYPARFPGASVVTLGIAALHARLFTGVYLERRLRAATLPGEIPLGGGGSA